jgi:hypothetical protein
MLSSHERFGLSTGLFSKWIRKEFHIFNSEWEQAREPSPSRKMKKKNNMFAYFTNYDTNDWILKGQTTLIER